MNNQEIKNKSNIHIGFAKIKLLAIFLCLLVCVIYLGVINTIAVKGYEVKKVEQKIEELRRENKQLEIEEAELNSFYNIKDSIGNLNMVEAQEVVYIDNNENVVAVRK
jgi:cell division protein FtsL